jgi:hypothetical protein
MDCKNTDNKYFFVLNISITPDNISCLLDQKVDHLSVQLPIAFKDYQKKKYMTIYNYTALLINNENNITPKHICLHCNLANPSNTTRIVDCSLFTYYRINPTT